MAIVVWKENKVISIELRTGLFVLAQMIKNPYLVFYNSFNTSGEWTEIDLENTPVLFCTATTRQFLQNSKVATLKKVTPYVGCKPPKHWIKMDALGGRTVKLWADTDDEMEVQILGNGEAELLERNILNTQVPAKTVQYFPPLDMEQIDNCELTNVRMFPELSERLYLCYKLQKNVDPLKNLCFGIYCPLEYKTYMRIINGSIEKEEWEALGI